jgi:hypothetical protein
MPDTSLRNTLIFLAIFIVAFFPSLFQVLLQTLRFPLRLPGADFAYKPPATLLPTCGCCSPASCSTTQIQAQGSPITPPTMSWFQKTITLPSKSRGSYLITDTILKEIPEIKTYKVG